MIILQGSATELLLQILWKCSWPTLRSVSISVPWNYITWKLQGSVYQEQLYLPWQSARVALTLQMLKPGSFLQTFLGLPGLYCGNQAGLINWDRKEAAVFANNCQHNSARNFLAKFKHSCFQHASWFSSENPTQEILWKTLPVMQLAKGVVQQSSLQRHRK